jgi:hypothetical protein
VGSFFAHRFKKARNLVICSDLVGREDCPPLYGYVFPNSHGAISSTPTGLVRSYRKPAKEELLTIMSIILD